MLSQKYSVKAEGLDLSFSTGAIAKLANGAVVVQSGQTMVLVTATMAPEVGENQDFFPLTVDYREKFSAAGRFPGGYVTVSYTHIRAHETPEHLVCRLLLEKKNLMIDHLTH